MARRGAAPPDPDRRAELRAAVLGSLIYVVLDTETTGLRPARGDRVVSLAGVRVEGGVVRREGAFDALVNPERPIPPASTRIHGITDRHVAGCPTLAEVLPAFLEFATGAVLVGHDIWFDLAFLEPAVRSLGRPALAATRPVLDTRLLFRLVAAPGPSDLDAIARRLGVSIADRHSALGDAVGAAQILARLLPVLEGHGIGTLPAAIEACERLPRHVH